jgi:hypothetical protein
MDFILPGNPEQDGYDSQTLSRLVFHSLFHTKGSFLSRGREKLFDAAREIIFDCQRFEL